MTARVARFSSRIEATGLLIFKLPNKSSSCGSGRVKEIFDREAMPVAYDKFPLCRNLRFLCASRTRATK
jgi:hypothetical protein